jgi:uncharacterized protein YjbI with pentapeptide repeats
MKLERAKQRIEASDADLSGSTFTNVKLAHAAFDDVDLAGATIHNARLSAVRISDANLTGASITGSQTEGMTINGISLADLMAAYRAAHPEANL